MPFEDGLPPGVAARVSAAQLWPADGHVHPPFDDESFPCSERTTGGFFLAVQTGAWAVGLPPAPHDRNERCTAGEPSPSRRGAVGRRSRHARWCHAPCRDVITDGSSDGHLIDFDDWDDPPMWGVDYTVADAEVALAMLDQPVDDVRAALAIDWARWTDPRTPSSALATGTRPRRDRCVADAVAERDLPVNVSICRRGHPASPASTRSPDRRSGS